MRGPVPNQFPTRESAYRLALIGEAPGEQECRLGYPFAGASGFLLDQALSSVGLSREECFLGNVCQFRPSESSNEFSLLDWNGCEVQSGIVQLCRDLASFQPHLIVCLGNVPLHLFKHGNVKPPHTPKAGYQWPSKVSSWRGSLFLSTPFASDGHQHSPSAAMDGPLTALDSGAAISSATLPGWNPGAGTNPANPPPVSKGPAPMPAPGETGSPPPAGSPSQPQEPARFFSAAPPNCCADPVNASAATCDTRAGGEGGLPSLASGEPPGFAAGLNEVRPSIGYTLYPVAECRVHRVLPPHQWKCLSAFHPAFIARAWSKMFDLRQDLRRAREEGSSPKLDLPVLDLAWGPPNPPLNEPPIEQQPSTPSPSCEPIPAPPC